MMAHQPDWSLKESRSSVLVTKCTLEITIPKIKNVMLIQLCHKPSYQVQVSLPLFYTSRFRRICAQRNGLISVTSFVSGYQLTCSYSLGTTLQIIGLSKIEMVLVLLLVPYPPNDPSVACQMTQPSIKIYEDISHHQIYNNMAVNILHLMRQ